MGRNSVAGTTSSQNIGEEYHTPKGGTRDVRVRVELSWATTHALSTKEGTTLAQSWQGHSSQEWCPLPSNCSMGVLAIDKRYL